MDLELWQARAIQLTTHSVVRAFALSFAAHLFLFATVEIGFRLGLWQHSLVSTLRLLKPDKPQPLTEQQKEKVSQENREMPVVFIDVDPLQSTEEAPEKAKYYSARNSKAGNPDTAQDTAVPRISGKQETVPSTVEKPRTPEPSPAEPPPPPPPAPVAKEEPPPPEPAKLAEAPAAPSPKPGDLAMAKPLETLRPRPDPSEVLSPPPALPPPARPRTLAAAKQQLGIIQERMKQDGGMKRFSVMESLDVRATPFGDYDAALIAAIQRRWYDLLDEHEFQHNHKGRVVLSFRLNSDGTVSQTQILENEVSEILALKCQRAIQDPAPYDPWPSDMRRYLGKDYRDVRFTFHHN